MMLRNTAARLLNEAQSISGAHQQHVTYGCLLQVRAYAESSGKGVDPEGPSSSTNQDTTAKRAQQLMKLFSEGGAQKVEIPSAPSRSDDTSSAVSTSEIEQRDVVAIVLQAVDNCKPYMKVRAMVEKVNTSRRVTYVPQVVSVGEQRSMAVKWILEAARKRQQSSKAKMAECLALEFLLAYQKKGSARLKRDELHKQALENRANVTTKWW